MALKKCVTSIARKGSSEPEAQVRARKLIKSLEKEFPKDFVSTMRKQGFIANAPNQLGASDGIALALEANFKTKDLRVVNKFIR